ncbi:MAG: MBL fold metallo-hydrolase, partial [Salinisphaera sp.]|nr:MBL fold metallo-hydrolase [Salinisphaera sp.]
MNWTIGDVKITSIYEQALHALQLIMPQATAAELANIDWLKPHYVDANGEMTGIIQAFIVDTGNTRIVVDTCVGDDRERALVEEWHRAQRRTIDKFAAAGYPPDAIDVVLCTHLHTDHVGWNTWYDGAKFVPTFRNARYLFARAEFDFWHKEIENCLPEADPHDEVSMLRAGFAAMMETTFADSVQPVLDAGLVDLVETDHRICEQVRFIPTPGHTPGHVSVVIESGGE